MSLVTNFLKCLSGGSGKKPLFSIVANHLRRNYADTQKADPNSKEVAVHNKRNRKAPKLEVMDFIRKKFKRLGRRISLKKSPLHSQGEGIVSLHRVQIPNDDIYQKLKTSRRSLKRLLAPELKDNTRPALSDVVLEIMGKENSSATIFGKPINNDLAVCLENLVTSGLTNEQRKDLKKAYLPPVNCKLIAAPALNPEVEKVITDFEKKQDKIIRNRQKQISRAIVCLGEALTLLLSKDTKDPTVRRLIMDTARILCDLQYNDSLIRRNNILSTLQKDLKKELAGTKIDGFLFGKEAPQSLHTIKIAESENNLDDHSKVQIATVLHTLSSPRATSSNRNWKHVDRNIEDSQGKKMSDLVDHKKMNNPREHTKFYDPKDCKKIYESSNYKKIQSSPKNSKHPIKGPLIVPLDKDSAQSPRSSKRTCSNKGNNRRQREKTPTESKASTSSSHRRR